eukprot:gene4982-5796_t
MATSSPSSLGTTINGKGSPSSQSLHSPSAPLSVISVSSSPLASKPSLGQSIPGSPGANNNLTQTLADTQNSNGSNSGHGPSAAGFTYNKVKVDYKFEEYEEAFFAKSIINDPLKISLIPDLLSIQSVPRQSKIAGQNIPGDLVLSKLPLGVQESVTVFKQEWTVVNRDALPTPSAGSNPLKALPVQSYEIDGDFEQGSAQDSVKDRNMDLVQMTKSPIPDPKIIDTLKNQRCPLFQTYNSDSGPLQPIELPRVGRPFSDAQTFQIQVECTEFKTVLGDIEPFFGRMFLYDTSVEDGVVISEVFHFDFGTHTELLPKSTEVEPPTKIKKAVFSCNKPSKDIYLVVCFDKVMRGDPEETTKIYFNLPGKPKEIAKFQSEVKESLPRLGNFRHPFVWGFTELFGADQSVTDGNQKDIKIQNLARIKGDLYNFVTKPEKKPTTWCDCTVRVQAMNESLATSQSSATFTNLSVGRIDYLLRAIHPQGPTPLIREMLSFEDANGVPEMNISYSNVLYFYPKSVNLTNFKSDKGSSARNIFLEVKILEDDSNVNNSGIKSIYGNSTAPLLTRRFYSAVGYHNRKPEWTDEIKINLPPALTPQHHLLVTFYHLGCRASKKNEKPEVCLGHTAIRLFENDHVIVDGKYKKPMATVFPPRYLEMEAKEQANTKMWVDNKRPVFAFRTRLVSTVFPQDPVLAFILKDGADSDQNQLIEMLKRVSEVPATLKLKFFPVIARILFKCISSLSKELQKHSLIALISIVDSISREPQGEEQLISYTSYIFSNASSSNSLHESLVQTWINLIESRDDIASLSLQISWFLFAIIRKSMVIDIDIKNLLKNGRNRSNRFTDEYLARFKALFEHLLSHAKQTSGAGPRSFINHVAYFINDLLDVMNRGFLFRLIHSYVTVLDTSPELTELKYTFLRVLSTSDSFISLNLPSNYTFPPIHDKHFLIGLMLQEVAGAVTSPDKKARLLAIQSLKEVMSRYDTSPLYNTVPIRERIAALYFPYVLIMVENADHFYKFDAAEQRLWMVCFIYVVKNLINSAGNVIGEWWKKETQRTKISTFFGLLNASVGLFEHGHADETAEPANAAVSLATSETSTDSPSRRPKDASRPKAKKAKSPELASVMSGNLSYEVAMTILNCIVVYIRENKAELKRNDPAKMAAVPLDKLFKCIVALLKRQQSHAFLRTTFQVLASMVTEFSATLFRANSPICSELTPEIFAYCTVGHAPNRQQATTLIYLMIQANLDEIGHFSRMKLQSTVSISKIVGVKIQKKQLLDFETLYACLESITKFVKTYCNSASSSAVRASSSPVKTSTGKPMASIATQIEELKDRLFGVIHNSVKIQQHEYDPEMKADLYHQLSNTFQESPDLRVTWLKSLATFLQANENWEEAAQTYIIAAALVVGYLKLLKRFPKNLAVDFSNVSPNINLDLTLPDPSLLEAVEGEVCQLEDFTEKGFINLLKEAIQVLKRGCFFESCIETYQLLLPTFQKNREWKRQYECYTALVVLCNQMISESSINQRLFANYYRVAFYGEAVIPDLHNREFIYKELNFVRLSDLSERLQKQYGGKFGEDKIHLLPNNKPVDKGSLNPQHIYFQIISVEPYLTPDELKERVSTFDQNTNLNKFIFEVPFTKSGKVHSENLADQCKRKTVLTTKSYFPYLKKRLPIIKKEDIELEPIEASIEIIQRKTQALRAELNSTLPNTKTLQIQLQGSLLLQVNAGPLAICSSFLAANDFDKYNAEHFTKLQESVKDFTNALGFAVKLNQQLSKEDGLELQAQLDRGYREFREKVKVYVPSLESSDDAN